ncbi:MAG: 3'-5' exonuclease domain-containing protein 2 [Ekhidna sp.]|nr:3'-5' exonuclease domain-containing protein 2 [Ekhidna sp.]MBC6411071.1 3'-5' exonuclease domain-containing protein 2 [Ekhidna sp.]MBC6425020.1 3'-5' exonuclease domain-containing protein 2 [Ekhidna sp.]
MNLFAEIIKEDIQKLPLRVFGGNIHVIETQEDCKKALSKLNAEDTIGFDTETKPSFLKGEYNSPAIVQLSTDEDAFLFRIQKIPHLSPLYQLLEDLSITKAGIGIADDLKNLNRVTPFTPQGFIDLNNTAREIGIKYIGVKKLAAICLECRISKSQQTSNWENEELTEAQQRYAATDAWVSLLIYKKLKLRHYSESGLRT